MGEKQFSKVDLAYGYDISPDTYVTLKETLPKYDANGNGSLSGKEIQDAINSMRGLSQNQKAVLCSYRYPQRAPKNNPNSTKIGQQVLDALNKG